ncbi:ferredoxin-NADP reductase [Phormidesmis sp. 146-12]
MTQTTASIPVNLYRPDHPLIGQCLLNEKLVHPGAVGDVRHIILRLPDKNFRYVEGQSIGIIPPGTNSKGKPHKLRLYSIASTRHGDHGDDQTVSLCVRLLEYPHPETGEIIYGTCSSHLCNMQPGDEVQIVGPVGNSFLLPNDPNATIIMMATGTGIAPFRAFLWRMFDEYHADYMFNGDAMLFFGIPTTANILYRNELEYLRDLDGTRLTIQYAISREQRNSRGGKMYIQDLIANYSTTLWHLLQRESTYVYICGLKGMEGGINEALSQAALEDGVDWAEYQKQLKKAGRWHVETY